MGLGLASWCPRLSNTLDFEQLCKENYLSEREILQFVTTLKTFCVSHGQDKCWCLKKAKNRELVANFSISQNMRPRYKGVDARELLLGFAGKFRPDPESVIVRYGYCESTYCINPLHYFFGTRQDAMWQHNARKGSRVSPELVQKLREECSHSKKSYAALARDHKLPYHVVRRICTHESFA